MPQITLFEAAYNKSFTWSSPGINIIIEQFKVKQHTDMNLKA